MQKLLAWLLFPALAFAAATNPPPPIQVRQFTVPANNAAFFEAQRQGVANLKSLQAVLALPAGFDPQKPWPVLLVTASSGSSAVQMWRAYTNVALAEGWVVAAVDGPRVAVESDTYTFSRAMIAALFEQLHRTWPQSKQWPVACAGFSGGGKRAAMTAADLMQRGEQVVGVFMGGSNNDRASDALFVSRPGEAFLDVPIFLSSGRNDPIAGPAAVSAVRQSMVQTGFRKTRLEIYPGGHQLDAGHLRTALQWFRPKAKAETLKN